MGGRTKTATRYGFALPPATFAIFFFISGCADYISAHEIAAPNPNSVSVSLSLVHPVWSDFLENLGDCATPGPLRNVWEQRKQAGDIYDFPIGTGDVLHVQVADLDELRDLEVRVGGDGTIALPLIGDMAVAGINVHELQTDILDRVREYVTHPRGHVFVSQYRSRSVEVMGMVAEPGAYALAGPADSILKVIGRAGGMQEHAAQRVILFPVEWNDKVGNRDIIASPRTACPDKADNPSINTSIDCNSPSLEALDVTGGDERSRRTDAEGEGAPIVIDLSEAASADCLDIPARPGDVVLVPAAGQVGVYGWVQKPGSFDVTAGMTVLGAVTAAGGAIYSPNAEILRAGARGQRAVLPLNLSRLESGDQQDIPVQAGDIVLVKGSALGLVPYALSTLLNKFGSGMYFAAP